MFVQLRVTVDLRIDVTVDDQDIEGSVVVKIEKAQPHFTGK